MQSVGEKTYTQAVREGKYDLYVGNLFGKYDNVRTYWEDQLTRIALRPFLHKLVESRRDEERGLRIVDLGCGAGQGYQILTKIDRCDLDLGLQHRRVLPEEEIDLYWGLDISQAMVDKGENLFASKPQVQFTQADLRQGFPQGEGEQFPFDIYEEKVRQYTMSYLYCESARQQLDIESFPLRFWTGKEVKDLVSELSTATGVGMEVLKLMDRSLLVGRHTDTREYNSQLKPTRRLINSLHEDYLRTDLQQLILDPTIVPEHPQVNPSLRQLIECWNILVEYCQHRLSHSFALPDLKGWNDFPKSLQFALMTIDRVIADVSWMWYGDPRANIIEPQLGYALRTLEYEMQRGWGCGHGLVAILRIQK